MTFIYLIFAIILIIVGITKFKVHPFLCLFAVAVLYGLAVGMPIQKIQESINDGFGKTLGNIGLVIIFGVIIGTFLENTGAALKITHAILKLIGPKRVSWAMALMGYIIGIPVFADSGFVILSTLNKTLTKKANLSIVGTGVALSMGLMATHTMVPPTPGPIAAAGIINAQLGLVILMGLGVSLMALIPVVFYTQYIGRKYFISPEISLEKTENTNAHSPTLFKSTLPIVVPLLLIILKSFDEYKHFLSEGFISETVKFIGNPTIALAIGILLAFLLPKKLEQKMISSEGWIGKSIIDSAEILMITGAGGIFGKVLQNSGLGDMIGQNFSDLNLGLLLPFFLAATIKTAQGSSTIAIITTASIISPMLNKLGLDTEISKTLVVLVIGAGSTVISHVNDSFFWVVTQLSGMNVPTGYRSHSIASALLGISALLVCYLIKFIV